MNWTKDLADQFVALRAAFDISNAAHDTAAKTLSDFLTAHNLPSDIAQVQMEVDGFYQGIAAGRVLSLLDTVFRHPVAVQNMTLNDATGWWESNPGTVGQMWTLRFDLRKYGVMGYGKKCRVAFWRQGAYPRDGNVKFFRVFNDLSGAKYPNFYVGQPNSTELFVYTELLSPFDYTKNHLGLTPTLYKVGDGAPHYEVYQWQWPSDYAKADGRFQILLDGALVMKCDTWQCEGTGAPDATGAVPVYKGLPWDLFIQDGPSNPATVFPATAYTKVRDAIEIGPDW